MQRNDSRSFRCYVYDPAFSLRVDEAAYFPHTFIYTAQDAECYIASVPLIGCYATQSKEHRLKKSSIIVLAILYKITYKNIPKCTKFLEKRFCVINTHKFVYNENGLSKAFRESK